jgi:hypothetical protein
LKTADLLKKPIDANAATSAISFDMGRVSVTLPLANTIFHNERPSTLLAHRFQVAEGTTRLIQTAEKQAQHVTLSSGPKPQSIGDINLHVPTTVPLTAPRKVLSSFGNIAKGVEIDGQNTPASTELEHVLNTCRVNPAFMPYIFTGVWAVVTPESYPTERLRSIYNGLAKWDAKGVNLEASQEELGRTSAEIHNVLSHGGRILKICKFILLHQRDAY